MTIQATVTMLRNLMSKKCTVIFFLKKEDAAKTLNLIRIVIAKLQHNFISAKMCFKEILSKDVGDSIVLA